MSSFFSDLIGDLGPVGDILGPIATIASIAAPIISGSQQAKAAGRVGDVAAATDAQNRSDLAPFRTTELLRQFALADALGIARPNFLPQDLAPAGGLTQGGGFRESPGYDFIKKESEKAALNALAARGQRWSGRPVAEAVGDRAAGLASTEFNNYLNTLAGLPNSGGVNQAIASTNNAGAGQQAGIVGAAGARASGLLSATNALTGFVNNQQALDLARQFAQRPQPTANGLSNFGGLPPGFAGSDLPELRFGSF